MSSKRCDYFLFTDYETKVHIYLDSASGAPVKLIHEVEVDKQDVPMLTYDYKDVVLGAPPNLSLRSPPWASKQRV